MKNVNPDKKNIIKNMRNVFRRGKEAKGIEDRILRDIKHLFEDYYKPVKGNSFCSNNYIEYKSNENR